MNGCHLAFHEPEVVDEHLDDRGEPVGRTRRIAHHIVTSGVVLLCVDAKDKRNVLVLGGRADNNLLDRPAHVGASLGGVSKDTGGLDDDVDLCRIPRDGGRFPLTEVRDVAPVEHDVVITLRNLVTPTAVGTVIPEHVGRDARLGERIVERNYFECARITVRDRLCDHPADAAGTVDANSCDQSFLPLPCDVVTSR